MEAMAAELARRREEDEKRAAEEAAASGSAGASGALEFTATAEFVRNIQVGRGHLTAA